MAEEKNTFGLKILFVEDTAENVGAVIDEVRRQFESPFLEIVSFEKAAQTLRDFVPHLVILDLREGIGGDKPVLSGIETLDHIWSHRFCPVIIYSSFADEFQDDEKQKHPLIGVVTKGSGSELKVLGHIMDFLPSVLALEKVGAEIGDVLNDSLRVVAPLVLPNMTERGDEMLVRSVRRRVAARMDEQLSSGGPKLKSWEHYLWPPISKHLLTGDILKRASASDKNPSSFYVVLSPSCDLVEEKGRAAKVNRVLVAQCKGVEHILPEAGLTTATRPSKIAEKLKPILTQGYSSSCLPLPALPGEFPSMVADLRALELIELTEIDIEGKTSYRRVASVDNPFRGLVSWAYSLTAARPGMPDRDFQAWADEFAAAIPASEGAAK